MKRSTHRTIRFLTLFGWILAALPAFAGGPLLVTKSGAPCLWDNARPIPFNPDRGPLGMMNNAEAEALVEEAFNVWASDAIPTANLDFENAGSLPVDVDTKSEFEKYFEADNGGINAVLFDNDGSFFTEMGLGQAVAGIAGPEVILEGPPCVILEGVALINGAFFDGQATNGEITRDELLTVLNHEFGHFLNLDHTQVNRQYVYGNMDEPGFQEFGPPPDDSTQLMFPIISPSTRPLSDDIAAVSFLYPGPGFSDLGTITGKVFEPDGATLFEGADVIARNVADPFGDVVSNVSGARYCSNPDCPGGGAAPPELKGSYELVGLTPGASYSIEVVNINPLFTEGSSVGSLTTPAVLCGPEEFYNASEAASDPPDDPSVYTPVGADGTVSGVNILFNGGGGVYSVSPDTFEFGSVDLGDSADATFTVENTGSGMLAGNASTDSPFSIVSGEGYRLGPGQKQDVIVRFSPGSSGNSIGEIRFACGGGSVVIRGVGVGGSGSSGGGCFIATAAFGSPLESHVRLLKRFRDEVLLSLPFGKRLVDFYYRVSPPIAREISKSEFQKFLVRAALMPAIGLAWIGVSATSGQKLLILLGATLLCAAYRYGRLKRFRPD